MQRSDSWSAVAELAASQHGVFHRRQADEHHIDSRRLQTAVTRGVVRRPMRDVFVYSSAPATWLQQLSVATLSGAVASHRSAAALHRLDGVRPGLIEVCFPRGREKSIPGARVHRWRRCEPRDVTAVDGIPCTSIPRTLVQLGAVSPPHIVEQALDSALRSGISARSIEDALDRLWRPGRSGAGVLAAVLASPLRSGILPDSWFERLVQKLVDIDGLPAPCLQHEVRLRSGRRRLDLAFPDAKLGIEAHSRRFHFGPAKEEDDHLRDLEFAAVGWEVIYVTWRMIHEPDTLVDLISTTYRTRLQLQSGGPQRQNPHTQPPNPGGRSIG